MTVSTRIWPRYLLYSFLFLLVPMAIIAQLCGHFFQQIREARADRAVVLLQRDLIRIMGWGDVPARLHACFKRWLRVLKHRQTDIPGFFREKAEQEANLGFASSVLVFGPRAQLLTPESVKVRSRKVLTKFWLYLQDGYFPGSQQERLNIRNMFGESFNRLRHGRGTILKFTGFGSSGLLYWDVFPYQREAGLLCIVWNIPDDVSFMKRRLQRLTGRFPYALLVENDDGTLHSLGRPVQGALPVLTETLKTQKTARTEAAGFLWVRMKGAGKTFFLGLPAKKEVLRRQETGVYLLLAILGGVLWGSLYRWMVLGREFPISIRWKQSLFFLYSLALPILGLGVVSYQAYQEYQKNLIAEIQAKGFELVKTLDDGFQQDLSRLAKNIARVKHAVAQVKTLPEAHRFGLWGRKRFLFNGLELRDGTGESLLVHGEAMATEDGSRQFMEGMYRDCIKMHAPHRMPSGMAERKPSMEEMVLKTVLDSKELGFGKIIDQPRVIHRLTMPKREVLFYWDLIENPNLPAVLFLCGGTISTAHEHYLRRGLAHRHALMNEGFRVAVAQENAKRWLPSHFENSRELFRLARHMEMTGERAVDRVTWKGQTWLVAGIPGRLMPGYSFLALYPEEKIAARLRRFQQVVVLGIVMVTVMTMLLSWILADTFLRPISELGHGIQALQESRLSYRLPDLGADEFGDLSRTFNDMMDNLQEMAAGKLVQEQLFPQHPLRVGEFAMCGVARSATNLGGDYFDYGLAGNRHWFLLIGDVTGHGIPAALIMAMSRAVVTGWIARGSLIPEDLLAELHAVIFASMKGRKFVTLALLWGNVETGEIRYFNNGHPYALRVDCRQARAEYVTARGTPIGTHFYKVKESVPIDLVPGERLVLYTDGLVETLTENDAGDGFEVFRGYVARTPPAPLEDYCRTLLENHPCVRAGGIQPDDFTVVVVERMPAGNPESGPSATPRGGGLGAEKPGQGHM
jgi:serine phosphatase RsbU (regulator of sigma subunit)